MTRIKQSGCVQRPLRTGFRLTIIIALVVAAAANRVAYGQVVGANVSGIVKDASGAVMAGVTVTINNVETGRTFTAKTDEEGSYRAVALQPGRYSLTATQTGFAASRQEVSLTVAADATVNFTLAVGSLQQTETVTASSEFGQIEVAKSQPRSAIVAKQVEALPVLDRNVLALAQLLPGSGPDNSLAGAQRFAVSKFGGAAEQRGSFTTLVDGGSVDDPVFGSPTVNVSQDAVQEFAVFRNQFDAQYGAAHSAVITIITKSGTNQFHGSASYFGRDRRLNARNAFAATRPPFDQQRLGGTFGGPLRRNQAHFFGSYELNTVDTAKIIALPPSNPFAAAENGIFPSGADTHNALFRVDYQMTPQHSLVARYLYDRQKSLRTVTVTADSNQADELNRTHSGVVEETWVISPTKVNSLRAHFFDHTIDTVPYSNDAGIARPSVTTGRHFRHPQLFPQKRVSLNESLYIRAGAHDLKFGGDFTWSKNEFESHLYEKGLFQFTTDAPFNPNDPRTYPISFTQQLPGRYRHNASEIGLYLQDDWRVGARLRLNLGLRYDLDLDFRQQDFYRQLLGDPRFAGLGRFVSTDRGPDSNNLQPRLGIAWDLRGDGSLVLRGGWGLYITRNRPWLQLRSMDQLLGSAVRIDDPAALKFFPDITKVLGGKSLDQFVSAGGAREVGVLADNIVQPYAHTTTAGAGWQLNRSTSLEVDYIHFVGENEFGTTDYNLPPAGAIGATNPRPVSNFTRVLVLENYTRSRYDALQAQLRSRLRKSDSLQVSYSLSRARRDGVEVYFHTRGTQRTPNERGLNGNDQRHNLTFSGSFQLPWQFQLSGIVKLISGSPMRAQAGVDLDGDRTVENDRPPSLPVTVGRGDVDSALRIINDFRATRQLPPVDRQLLKLDPFRSLDARLSRTFSFGESRLELLIEGFNLTNHVNFEPFTVNMNLVSTAFLRRASARDARQIQWGVRYVF